MLLVLHANDCQALYALHFKWPQSGSTSASALPVLGGHTRSVLET